MNPAEDKVPAGWNALPKRIKLKIVTMAMTPGEATPENPVDYETTLALARISSTAPLVFDIVKKKGGMLTVMGGTNRRLSKQKRELQSLVDECLRLPGEKYYVPFTDEEVERLGLPSLKKLILLKKQLKIVKGKYTRLNRIVRVMHPILEGCQQRVAREERKRNPPKVKNPHYWSETNQRRRRFARSIADPIKREEELAKFDRDVKEQLARNLADPDPWWTKHWRA